MGYKATVLKLKIERIGMFPFVLLGRLYGRIRPLRPSASHYIFSPSADFGGSTRNNAEIAECIQDHRPFIIFSKKPKNNGFRHLYDIPGVRILDLHRQIDNKLYHFVNFFWRGVLAEWIDRSDNPVVFGGESLYFYKVIPHLRKDIPCIELCHLPTWLPYNIGLINRITVRVCSTMKLKEAILEQYDREHIDRKYYDKVRFIENKIYIPPYRENQKPRLEVLFAGRGAPQKRVHLIAAIAKKMNDQGLPVHFSFAGDVDKAIDPAQFPFCTFYGVVDKEEKMQEIYGQSDVLILTSAFEGLPLTVMQTMAYGRVVLSTAVNAIPDYISHMENGLLIRSTEEDRIIEEGVALLRLLIEQPELKTRLGKRSREIAIEKFGEEAFCREYMKILIR